MQMDKLCRLFLKPSEIQEQEDIIEPITLLPEYGELNIQNHNLFLKLSKNKFDTIWCQMQEFTLLDFIVIKFISSGSFSKIYMVQNKSKFSYHAMKVVKKSEIMKRSQLRHIKNEKYILQRLNFPFIVHLECCFKDNTNVYFITPLYSGQELFYLIHKFKKLEEQLSRFIAAQVVLAIEYLHYLDIIYRDLKPENIVFDHTGYIKLTDFGYAKIVKRRTYTMCGTLEYIAPEMIFNKGYGKAVDWWAFGVLLYEMNFGSTPFTIKVRRIHLSSQYGAITTMPSFFSCDLNDLITNTLQIDLTKRFGNLKNGVDDIKNHQWFHSIIWLSLLNRCLDPPYKPQEMCFNEVDRDLELHIPISENNEFEKEFADF